jgi:purine catabolism regulator
MNEALLGLAEALAKLEGRGEVCAGLQQTLTPVVTYDTRTGSDLAHTLRVYVECGGTMAAAADRLFLHRNSVLYRLQRIEELAGIDLHDRATRLLLLVAFTVTDRATLGHLSDEERDDEDERP